jgi:hypothetical protein
VTCGKTSCHTCEPRTSEHHFTGHTQCEQCTRSWLQTSFDDAAIPGSLLTDDEKRLLTRTIDRAATILPNATAESWKPNTLQGYSRIARAMVNYGLARNEMFMGTAAFMSKAQIACYYIDRVDEGEGVAPSTADSELTVASHWWADFIERFPEFKNHEHPVKNKLVQDLQRRAKLRYQEASEPKVGFEIFEIKAYWHDGVISGTWLYDHNRLCIGSFSPAVWPPPTSCSAGTGGVQRPALTATSIGAVTVLTAHTCW